MDFAKWYEIVFYVPFLIGIMFLLLTAVGALPTDGPDADIDTDIHGDFDHDLDSSPHGDAGEHEHGVLDKTLGALGFGRVPVSIILMSFSFLWGFFGWASNRVLESVGLNLDLFGWISLASAAATSVLLIGLISRLLARIMPTTESYGTKEADYVGKRAVTRYPVTEHSGAAYVRDSNGDQQEVLCRVAPSQESIPDGVSVVLLRYDGEKHVFFVGPDKLSQVL